MQTFHFFSNMWNNPCFSCIQAPNQTCLVGTFDIYCCCFLHLQRTSPFIDHWFISTLLPLSYVPSLTLPSFPRLVTTSPIASPKTPSLHIIPSCFSVRIHFPSFSGSVNLFQWWHLPYHCGCDCILLHCNLQSSQSYLLHFPHISTHSHISIQMHG